MGLMIHSLGELPVDAERGYYIYVLDHGWHEPLRNVVYQNFEKMADMASTNNSVVIRGTVGSHFVDEVFSWHHINGIPGEEVLPAILITTRNPHQFMAGGLEKGFSDAHYLRNNRGVNSHHDDNLLLIPLKQVCKTSEEIVEVIQKMFRDIRDKKALTDFEVAKEIKRRNSGVLVDALILQPNFSGVGIDLNYIVNFFRKRK